MVHFHCVLPMLAERFFGHDFHFPAFTLLFSSPATMLWSYLSDPCLAGLILCGCIMNRIYRVSPSGFCSTDRPFIADDHWWSTGKHTLNCLDLMRDYGDDVL